MNANYQLGLLHFVHVLINADGTVDKREIEAIRTIQQEEAIEDVLFQEFSQSIALLSSRDIYNKGIELLEQCTEEEKLCAFVHLFRLAEADESICRNEVKHLLNAIKITNIDLSDVLMAAHLASSSKIIAN